MGQQRRQIVGDFRQLLHQNQTVGIISVLEEVDAQLTGAGQIFGQVERLRVIAGFVVFRVQATGGERFEGGIRIDQMGQLRFFVNDAGIGQHEKIRGAEQQRIPENGKAGVQQALDAALILHQLLQAVVPAVVSVIESLKPVEKLRQAARLRHFQQIVGNGAGDVPGKGMIKDQYVLRNRFCQQICRYGVADADPPRRPVLLIQQEYGTPQIQQI